MSTDFFRGPQHQISRKIIQCEQRRFMSTDGQTTDGKMKLIGAFRDYDSASKVCKLVQSHPRTWWLLIRLRFSKMHIQNIPIGYYKRPGTIQSLTLTARW